MSPEDAGGLERVDETSYPGEELELLRLTAGGPKHSNRADTLPTVACREGVEILVAYRIRGTLCVASTVKAK